MALPTFLAGQIVQASDLATLVAYLTPPTAVMYRSTSQSIANNSYTTVDLTSELSDTNGAHDTSTNPSRYTCPIAGDWLLLGAGSIVANATGGRGIRLLKNGSAIEGSAKFETNASASFGWVGQTSLIVTLAVGDYVQMQLYQNSGGALNTDSGSVENYPRMSVALLRRS